MSKALDAAAREVTRIWEASDRFDAKVLQFVAIIGAGAFAGAAIVAKGELAPPPGCWGVLVRALAVGAMASILVFFVQAVGAALKPQPFGSGVDPRLLADQPELLKDDEKFGALALPALGKAFEVSIASHHSKVEGFRKSLKWLFVAILALAAIGVIYVVQPAS